VAAVDEEGTYSCEQAIAKNQEYASNIDREGESPLESYTDTCCGCSQQLISKISAEEGE